MPAYAHDQPERVLVSGGHYVNLPSNVVAHYTSEAWAFSTIWPAIFETAELVSTFRGARPSSLAPRQCFTMYVLVRHLL
jgi:hypothetical protein